MIKCHPVVIYRFCIDLIIREINLPRKALEIVISCERRFRYSHRQYALVMPVTSAFLATKIEILNADRGKTGLSKIDLKCVGVQSTSREQNYHHIVQVSRP